MRGREGGKKVEHGRDLFSGQLSAVACLALILMHTLDNSTIYVLGLCLAL